MNFLNNFEQFSRQLSDLQRGFFNNWASAVPSLQTSNPLNFSETLDKTLKFQEEVVTNSLEFQALVARMSIETQKQFWEAYFNVLRQAQIKKNE
jgi:hypothetical protein